MTLSTQQQVDVRRYCGYSVSGNTTAMPYREPAYSNVTLASLSIDYRLANLLPEEENTLTTIYLANLYLREAEVQAAAANLDTDQAAVWTHNRDEVAQRQSLYTALRLDLCRFLGFPPGSGLVGRNQVIRA